MICTISWVFEGIVLKTLRTKKTLREDKSTTRSRQGWPPIWLCCMAKKVSAQSPSHTWFKNKRGDISPRRNTKEVVSKKHKKEDCAITSSVDINTITPVPVGLLWALQKYTYADFIFRSIIPYNKMLSFEEKEGHDPTVNIKDHTSCSKKKMHWNSHNCIFLLHAMTPNCIFHNWDLKLGHLIMTRDLKIGSRFYFHI